MAQATAICPGSIHVCKARFSRLNADGTYKAGLSNHVVTDQIVSVDYSPSVKAGDAKEVTSGCDCVPLSYRGYDKLMRFELKFQMTVYNPAVMELLLGASLLVDTSTVPVPVGVVFPSQSTCASTPQPPVCAEFWSDAWSGDAQAASPYRYIRWIFPMVFWQPEAGKLDGDFSLPSFTGWTRGNPNWPNAYADWPVGIAGSMSPAAYFWDNTTPLASCGYSNLST